jgi:spore coat protein CotF
MNDKMMIEDLLTTVKALCDLYMHATIEATTISVREAFNNSLFECLKIQNEIYTKMSEHGWYQKEMAETSKIQQTEKKFVNQATL